MFKKEASSAIVKLANDCSQRDLSTIAFSSSKDRSDQQQQAQDDRQWQQVNEHIATLHRENQRQFRTLEQQLVQLVERNSDNHHRQEEFLPAIRDELAACVSQCHQLQHGACNAVLCCTRGGGGWSPVEQHCALLTTADLSLSQSWCSWQTELTAKVGRSRG